MLFFFVEPHGLPLFFADPLDITISALSPVETGYLRKRRQNGIIRTLFERQRRKMKEGIHPTYEDATITCACGNVIKTRSTKKEMQVNTCSACHPYFTGQKTMVDTEGRVDTFKKRYAKFQKKA